MSMITMSKSKQEVRLFTCSLCCEDKLPSSLCLLQKCFHESCKDCLIKWIEKEESSGRSSLPTCPFCRVALTENDTGAILGRPYKPQASTATAPDETQVDDLTLQWLQEHTKLCPRCGARIEKLQGGCDMMECLCGCRFCYGCGSPNAQCPCTPAHHCFYDNITDGVASRSPPAQAVMDEGTGQIDLRAHIIARKQQEGIKKKRNERARRRRMIPIEQEQVDANTLSAKWLFCKTQVGLRILDEQSQAKMVRVEREIRRRQNAMEIRKEGVSISSAQFLFCNEKTFLRMLSEQEKATRRRNIRAIGRRLDCQQEKKAIDHVIENGVWLFRDNAYAKTLALLTTLYRNQRQRKGYYIAQKGENAVDNVIENGVWLFKQDARAKTLKLLAILYRNQALNEQSLSQRNYAQW